MLIGYMRVSTADQSLDLQRDALLASDVRPDRIYEDVCSGKSTERPGLARALDVARDGDAIVVWKLDRVGRSLPHVVGLVGDLQKRGVGLKVLTGDIDTTTPTGRLVFGIFATLAEFERDLIHERTMAGLAAARARGAPAAPTRYDQAEGQSRDGAHGRSRQCRARCRPPTRRVAVHSLRLRQRKRRAPRTCPGAAGVEEAASLNSHGMIGGRGSAGRLFLQGFR